MWKEVKKQLIIKEFKNICFLNFLEKKERKNTDSYRLNHFVAFKIGNHVETSRLLEIDSGKPDWSDVLPRSQWPSNLQGQGSIWMFW